MATGEKTRAGDEQFWRHLRFKENHAGDGFDCDCYSVYGDDSHVVDVVENLAIASFLFISASFFWAFSSTGSSNGKAPCPADWLPARLVTSAAMLPV